MKNCRVFLGKLRLEFTQSDLDLLRNYLPLIHRAISEQIDNVNFFSLFN